MICSFILGVVNLSVYAGESDATLPPKSHEDSKEGEVEITPKSQEAAEIKVQTIELKELPIYISAPGEVIINQNQSAIISPRIRAQVVKRLVNVGEKVTKGTPLIRLTSVEMAEAQGQLLLAAKEWWRVRELGEKITTAKYYQTVEVNYQQDFSKLLAYGMTKSQVEDFVKSDNANKANGEFTLLSPRNGTVFQADFVEGQMINPGEILYKIVDESVLWVNAQLANGDADRVKTGNKSLITTAHEVVPARVLQIHHQLDETTRTQVARLVADNPKDALHPGEFVTCLIQVDQTEPVLAIPQDALIRTPDGDHAIYVEIKPNHFKAQEVDIINEIDGLKVIKGVTPGTRFVVKGAFFVHSEAMKSGFNVHNH
ncbi:MAG: efflux RND transporter periplasmic adaptor subunit [Gammaproteobacteria bacterium]|nr:MAG: efflux RND transporter periplasmic adaptor subunit [Gammaproteobacteria bacterium]